MTGDAKKRLMDCRGVVGEPVPKRQLVNSRGCGEDKISNLPRELITRILKRLPTHDVVRTSSLSKYWRTIWCTHPYLVLDYQFYSQLTSKIEQGTLKSEFQKVFNMILSSHTGPISYFHIYITPAICYTSIQFWVDQLCDKGLRTVVFLLEEKKVYRLPSALFNCPELTMLRLYNSLVVPSRESGSFTNLTRVQLFYTSIISDMTFGKQLKKLHLLGCKGIECLDRQFRKGNNLESLNIATSSLFKWQWLQRTRKLVYLGLGLGFTAADSKMIKVHELIKLLGEISTFRHLFLDAPTLEVLGPPPSDVMRPKTKAVNLRRLTLFSQPCQISKVVYLIRSFPNLQNLCIQLALDQVKSSSPTEITTEYYSESLDWKDMYLDQLQTVEIKGVVDSKYVLYLLKHLLASSPSLKVISLFFNSEYTDTKEKLRIKQELQLFPRLSLDAQERRSTHLQVTREICSLYPEEWRRTFVRYILRNDGRTHLFKQHVKEVYRFNDSMEVCKEQKLGISQIWVMIAVAILPSALSNGGFCLGLKRRRCNDLTTLFKE